MEIRLPPQLETILQQDGFVIFISGRKNKGKTNLGMLLSEACRDRKYRDKISTNIFTEAYDITQITNYPDLEEWLNGSGKKLYVLDEAGKHIKKMRFMTEQNQKIMELIQLIRHYDAGLIGIAPSDRFVDSTFLDTDILDAWIRKITQRDAIVNDYFNDDTYFLQQIPKTSLIHNSKDIASFSMEKKVTFSEMQDCCRVAKLLEGNSRISFQQIGKTFVPPIQVNQVKDLLRDHLRHLQFTNNHEVKKSIKPASEA